MHILIPEAILPKSLARLRASHSVHYDPKLVQRPDELVDAARGADAIIVRRLTQVRGALLDAMPRCRAVGRLGVGLDNIDVEACRRREIAVVSTPGANARSVAEYVIATTMMLLRTAYLSTQEVVDGQWPKERLNLGRETQGHVMGIVGYGAIGRITGALAQALGMHVKIHDPARADDPLVPHEHVGLDELFSTCDVVTLHVPLTPATRNFVDAPRIASMKRGAIVINAARGGMIDEAALIEALRSGALGGAALDAFEDEPLGPSPQYAGVPNLILTPHIAGVTAESEVRVNEVVVAGVLRALEGDR